MHDIGRWNSYVEEYGRTEANGTSSHHGNSQNEKSPNKSSSVAEAFFVMSLSPTTSYKAAEPTIGPWTIKHDSFFKATWDWIILILVIYTAIEIPYNVAFLLPLSEDVIFEGHTSALAVINVIVDIMFIVDIVINFRTTYVCNRGVRVVCEPRKIALHYLKSWFVVDFMAAIPFELFAYISSKKEEFTLIGLLKTARLLRLVRVARKLDRYSEYGVAVVFLLMGLFTLSAHWLACIWYAIGKAEESHQAGWINILARDLSGWTAENVSSSSVSLSSCYITSLYFTLSSLTSVGFGNVSSNTNAEKVFAVCVMLIGALMYATIFGNLTAIIQRLYSKTSKYHKNLTVVKEFIRFYEIPSPLSDRLEEYSRSIWTQTRGVDLQKVLEGFPESLQGDVCYHLRKDLFESVAAFKEADQACLRSLSMKFQTAYYLPDQCITRRGDPIHSIYFLGSGIVEISRDGRSVLSLGKGDVISCDYKCEEHIPKANADLTSRSLTEVHCIDYDDLLGCLQAFPVFGQTFFERLEVSYSLQEFANVDENFVERSRRFSNAKFELASFHKFAKGDKKEYKRNGSTYIELETILPASDEVSKMTEQRQMEDEKQGENLNEKKVDVGISEVTFSDRLTNIEDRLSRLEYNINNNFNQLMQHLNDKQ